MIHTIILLLFIYCHILHASETVQRVEQPCILLADGTVQIPVCLYIYDEFNHLISFTDPRGYTTSYERDARGQPTQIVYPDGSRELYSYTSQGRLESYVDAKKRTTFFYYDYHGRVVCKEIYDADGVFFSKICNSYRQRLRIEKDAMGNSICYAFDAAGRLFQKIQGDKFIEYIHRSDEERTYEPWGTNARVTVKSYNSLHQLIEERIEDEEGTLFKSKRYEYDEMGNCLHFRLWSHKGEAHTKMEYDSEGRLKKVINPLGYATSYTNSFEINQLDQKVRQSCKIDPNGLKTTDEYDALDRISHRSMTSLAGELLHETLFYYDLSGNLVQRKDYSPTVNLTTAWTYDCMGRIITHTQATGTSAQMTYSYLYNELGEKSSVIKPDGTVVHYEYDAMGRLACLYSSDGTVHYHYSYDLNHNLTKIFDCIEGQLTHRTYDSFHRVVKEKLGNELEIQRQYDTLDRVAVLKLPEGMGTVKYTYDAIGYLKILRINGDNKSLQFSLANHLNTAQLPFGIGKHRFAYDFSGRCIQSKNQEYDDQLSYNSTGQLIHRIIQLSDEISENKFEYDGLYRLIDEGNISYRYDSLGNRLEKNGFRYERNALGQILQDAENQYSYDANGNLILQTGLNGPIYYKYDALNRLINVKTQKEEWQYSYDSFNRRLRKKSADKTIDFLYDNQDEIGSWENGICSELRTLEPCEIEEMRKAIFLEINKKAYFPLTDPLGNIIALFNQEGKLVQSYRYSAYGEEAIGSKPITPWRYASKRTDPETGFVHFGSEYYSPSLGRGFSVLF